MARTPYSLPTTMAGQFTAEIFSVAWVLVTSLFYPFFRIPIVGGWIQSIVADANNNLLNALQPAGPGVVDWWITLAETPGRGIQYTRWALEAHKGWIKWIVYQVIPDWFNGAIRYTTDAINGVYWYLHAYIEPYLDSLQWQINNTNYVLMLWVHYLDNEIVSYFNVSIDYTNQVYYTLQNYANYLYNQSIEYTYNVSQEIVAYIRTVRDELLSEIADTKRVLQFELAAAVTFITTVFVPAAIAAFKLEQTEEIAVGMDALWPLVAKSMDMSALAIVLRHPTVAARAALIPPEPVPGIGGAVEALTSALSFQSAVTESITTPMATNLEQFGEDIHGLGVLIPTVILGGFTAAAIAEPKGTAHVAAEWLFESINDILNEVAEDVGIATK